MKNPTAIEFFCQWKKVAAFRLDELLTNWSKRKKFTSIVKDEEECIVEKIAENLGLRCYSEYYHTDTIFFDDDDLVPEKADGQTWVRGLKIAFEHEHSYDNKLYEEISHLLILHAPLSVVVTYPPPGGFAELPHLQYFHKIIDGSPRAKELDANESFLLIFGYPEPAHWRGLIYKSEGWKEIQTVEISNENQSNQSKAT
jgi:hypothetical protein